MSKPRARQTELRESVATRPRSRGASIAVLAWSLSGIVWIVVYINLAMDAADYDKPPGLPEAATRSR